ncbi:MAG: tandem-95 repeat protein [Euryarchaeota archaeon]|nr:tandem-95 repeat protein [Euryarchaeota archaeon]
MKNVGVSGGRGSLDVRVFSATALVLVMIASALAAPVQAQESAPAASEEGAARLQGGTNAVGPVANGIMPAALGDEGRPGASPVRDVPSVPAFSPIDAASGEPSLASIMPGERAVSAEIARQSSAVTVPRKFEGSRLPLASSQMERAPGHGTGAPPPSQNGGGGNRPLVTLTLQPGPTDGKDCCIVSSLPSANSGASQTMDVCALTTYYKTLLQFDLSSIPPGSRVTAATLGLYQSSQLNTAGVTVGVYRLTRSWTEGTGTYTSTGDGATWNTYNGVSAWTTPGGDYAATQYASVVQTTSGWYTFDVRQLFDEWTYGTYANFGLALVGVSGSSNNWKEYWSSDYVTGPTFRPYVTITYTIDALPPVSSAGASSQYAWTATPIIVPFTATDNLNLGSISLYYRYSSDNLSWSGWLLSSSQVLSGASASGTFSFFAPWGSRYYEFYTRATDAVGNVEGAKSAAEGEIIYDSSPPFSSAQPLLPTYTLAPFDIMYFAQDNLALSSVTLYYRFSPDGGATIPWTPWTANYTISISGTIVIANLPFYAPNGKGYYQVSTQASDIAGWVEPLHAFADASTLYDPGGAFPPTDLTIWNAGDDLTIGWEASSTPDVIRYDIFKATDPSLFDWSAPYASVPSGPVAAVLNETVYGPATGGEMGPWFLMNVPVIDAAVYRENSGAWSLLVGSADYTLDTDTGELAMLAPLMAGDSIFVSYNYSVQVMNEYVFGPAGGGESGPFYLAGTPVYNATILLENSGVWIPLTEGVDYILIPSIGELWMLFPLAANDNLFANYNMSFTISNELAYGPAIGGETGDFNLANSVINDCTLYLESPGGWTQLVDGVNYNLANPGGVLTIFFELKPGETLYAYYNYTTPSTGSFTFTDFDAANDWVPDYYSVRGVDSYGDPSTNTNYVCNLDWWVETFQEHAGLSVSMGGNIYITGTGNLTLHDSDVEALNLTQSAGGTLFMDPSALVLYGDLWVEGVAVFANTAIGLPNGDVIVTNTGNLTTYICLISVQNIFEWFGGIIFLEQTGLSLGGDFRTSGLAALIGPNTVLTADNIYVMFSGAMTVLESSISVSGFAVWPSGTLYTDASDIILDGDFWLDGTAAMVDTTLTMDVTTNGEHVIQVNASGSLTLQYTVVTNGTADANYLFMVYGALVMTGCNMTNCGIDQPPGLWASGLYIAGTAVIDSSAISDCADGIAVDETAAAIINNCAISDCVAGIYAVNNTNLALSNNVVSGNGVNWMGANTTLVNDTMESGTSQWTTNTQTIGSPSVILMNDDVEGGTNGWTTIAYSGASLWHIATLNSHSPTHSWWCGLDSTGNYNNGQRVNNAILSPIMDTSSLAWPWMSIWENYNTELGWDYCMVGVSTNGGTSWNTLASRSGNSGGWVKTNWNVTAYKSSTFRIRFYFDTGDAALNSYPGWFIDDIMLNSTGSSVSYKFAQTTSTSHSPTTSWTDSPTGNYPDGANIWLQIAAPIDLRWPTEATLSYWMKYQTEFNNDVAVLEISTSGGASWMTIKSYSGTSPGYPGSFIYDTVNLNAYVGTPNFLFRFHMISNTNGIVGDGFYVDDVLLVARQKNIKGGGIILAGTTVATLQDNIVRDNQNWGVFSDGTASAAWIANTYAEGRNNPFRIMGGILVNGGACSFDNSSVWTTDVIVAPGAQMEYADSNSTMTARYVEVYGTLWVNSSKWLVNSTYDGECYILVVGAMHVYGCIIDSVLPSGGNFIYYVDSSAVFSFVYSELHHCGWDGIYWSDLGLYINTDNALIDHSTLSYNFINAVLYESSPVVQDCIIQYSSGSASVPGIGLLTVSTGSPIIDNNYINNCSDWGIYAFYGSTPVVTRNNLSWNGAGAIFNASSAGLMDNNTVTRNKGLGILCFDFSAPILNNNLIIYNNATGIRVDSDSTPTITGNYIAQQQVGIELVNYSGGTIWNNTIRNNSLSGVSSTYSAPAILGNNVIYNARGVYIENCTPDISDNVICWNAQEGIFWYGADVVAILRDNNVSANGLDGISLNGLNSVTLNTADCTGNAVAYNRRNGIYAYGGLTVDITMDSNTNGIDYNNRSGLYAYSPGDIYATVSQDIGYNNYSGLYLYGNSVTVSVTSSQMSSNVFAGIYLRGSDIDAIVLDSDFYLNGFAGAYLQGTYVAVDIEDCAFFNNSVGLDLEASAYITGAVESCSAAYNSDTGLNVTGAGGMSVSGNALSFNRNAGISVRNSSGIRIELNVVTGNGFGANGTNSSGIRTESSFVTCLGNDVTGSPVGIWANTGTTGLFENNSITSNTFGVRVGSSPTFSYNYIADNAQYGMLCPGYSPLISENALFRNIISGIYISQGATPYLEGNTLRNNGCGVIVANGSRPTIANNVISYNFQDGVSITNGSDVTIINNEIFYNIGYGLNCSNTSRANWFGDISSGGHYGFAKMNSIVMYGNLTVLGGGSRITLEDLTLTLGARAQCDLSITVISGGTLAMNDASVGTLASDRFAFFFNVYGALEMDFASVARPYQIYAADGSSLKVLRSTISESYYEGIFADSGSEVFVSGSHFYDCGDAGIYANSTPITVIGTYFDLNYRGLWLFDAPGITSVQDCIFRYNTREGLLAESSAVAVSGSTFEGNLRGMRLRGSAGSTLDGCHFTGSEVAVDSFGSALEARTTTMEGNNVGFFVYQGSVAYVENCSMDDLVQEFYVWNGSDARTLNTTFDAATLVSDTSVLTVQWFLHVGVLTAGGMPIAGAVINVTDGLGAPIVSGGPTGADGFLRWIVCTGYVKTAAGVDGSMNPCSLTAFDLQSTASRIVTMDTSRTEIFSTNYPPVYIAGSLSDVTLSEEGAINDVFDLDNCFVDEGTLTYSCWGYDKTVVTIEPNGFFDVSSPAEDWAGAESVTFRATDSYGLYAERTITVAVLNLNDPPAVSSTPALGATQGAPYYYDLDGSDPDLPYGDLITYSLLASPAGMGIDAATGAITWVPGSAQIGPNPVTVNVSDSAGAWATQTFIVSVANVNDAPGFTSAPVMAATQGAAYSYDVDATDPDIAYGDSLTYSITTFPAGMAIDSATGLVSWIPTNAQVGPNSVTARVADSVGASAVQQFIITVSNVNDPPSITSSPVLTGTQGAPYFYGVSASDPDSGYGDTLAYSLLTSPAGMAINATTGLVSWTPGPTQVGPSVVIVRAADSSGSAASQQFVITVSNINDPPSITSTPILAATQGAPYSYAVTASDPDTPYGDSLSFSLTTFPAGMAIDPATGMITWTPGPAQVGADSVIVKATDSSGASAVQQFVVAVANVNDPPAIASSPLLAATQGSTYYYDVDATDPDTPYGDALTYSLLTFPAGMAINATTGLITWTPGAAQVGQNAVIVRVMDTASAAATQQFVITVSNINDPPSITSAPVLTATQGVLYSYVVTATDSDGAYGDSLSFGLTTCPTGMSIDSASGAISWTPGSAQIGSNAVTVKVTDGSGAFALQPFVITVANVNDPPAMSSSPTTIAVQGVQYYYDVDAADPDTPYGDLLTYSLVTSPAGMGINASTGLISWAPGAAQVGQHTVIVRVADIASAFATQQFTVTVSNVNDPPSITSAAILSATQGISYSYIVTATDADTAFGDPLSFSLTTCPAGMSIDSASGAISWTPTSTQIGTNSVTVRVADSIGASALQQFVVTVANVNDPPSITSAPGLAAAQGDQYFYDVVASDPDKPYGDTLTYSLTTSPAGMAINAATGLISWTPGSAQVGQHTVIVRVADMASSFAAQQFVITVSNINDPPAITSTPALAATQGIPYAYAASATDPDTPYGDTLSYSLTTCPAGMAVDPASGAVTWTPANSQVGANSVTLRVADSHGLCSLQQFTIAVANVNDGPAISSTPVLAATQGALYFYDVEAADPDTPYGDALTYSLITSPAGMAINAATGLVSWTPGPSQVGLNAVSVNASDTGGKWSVQQFAVNVMNVNDAPSIGSYPALTATAGAMYSYAINATDADTPYGDSLTYRLTRYPEGMGIDSATGLVYWTPTVTSAESAVVSLQVTDSGGLSAAQTFTVTVSGIDHAPRIAGVGVSPGETYANSTLTATPSGWSDADNDTPSYRYQWLRNGLEVAGATGQTVSGIFQKGDIIACEVTPYDGRLPGASVVSLAVTIKNTPPTLRSASITTIAPRTGDALAVAPQGYADIDAADGAPAYAYQWQRFDAPTSTWENITGANSEALAVPLAKGTVVHCTVIPFDGTGYGAPVTTQSVTVQNTVATLTSEKAAPESAEEKTTFRFSVIYSDADGDAPLLAQVVIDGTPYDMNRGAGGSDRTGVLYTYETSALSVGTHSVYYTSADEAGSLAITGSSVLTVRAIPSAPAEPFPTLLVFGAIGIALAIILLIVIAVYLFRKK